jgi:hypothetical protein
VGVSLPSNPMTMAASVMRAAGSSVAGANAGRAAAPAHYTPVGSRLALKFVGSMHAVDVALFTSRRNAAFPVAKLSVRGCEMTNQETRGGRIEVAASVGSLALTDLTPSATKWPSPLVFTSTMGVEQPALDGSKIAQGQW